MRQTVLYHCIILHYITLLLSSILVCDVFTFADFVSKAMKTDKMDN